MRWLILSIILTMIIGCSAGRYHWNEKAQRCFDNEKKQFASSVMCDK